MYKPSLEKRFKGFHYEVGRMPDFLAESRLVWTLPHDLRRKAYLSMFRGSAGQIENLRTRNPEDKNTSTLKPLIESKALFVHIPKAAGISISFGLFGRKTGDHRTIADYKICLSKSEFESMFKFTFVRNPWDRALSAYLYLMEGGRNAQDSEWASRYLAKYSDFNDFVANWVNEENVRSALHFRPQHTFLCTDALKPEVDFIGRFERIREDYEHVRSVLGSGGELKDHNRTSGKNKHYREYYTDRSAGIIESVYKSDVNMFGYEFDEAKVGVSPY